MEFKLVYDANAVIAETPVWDRRNNCLYFTDMFKGGVVEYDAKKGKKRRWTLKWGDGKPKWVGSCILCADFGKILAVAEGGIYLIDKESGKIDLLCNPEERPENRWNDARCDARGRLFSSTVAKSFGTPAYTPDQRGAFYMVEKGKAKIVADGINQYNGIVWSPDSTKMYVADTFNNALLEWDYSLDKGPVGKSRVVIDFAGKQGMPDGLNADYEGNIYVSHWTGKISIWDKNFKLKKTVKFPVEQACCGGFGGPDLKDFYVATAHYAYTKEQLKNRSGAGGIFLARSSVAGLPENYFVG